MATTKLKSHPTTKGFLGGGSSSSFIGRALIPSLMLYVGLLVGCTATLSSFRASSSLSTVTSEAPALAVVAAALQSFNDNYHSIMKTVSETATSFKYSLEEIAPDDEFESKRIRVEFYYHFLFAAIHVVGREGRGNLGNDVGALEEMVQDLNALGYLSHVEPEKFPDPKKARQWEYLSTKKGWYEFWKHGDGDLRDLDHHLMQLKQDQQLLAVIFQNVWQSYIHSSREQLVEKMGEWTSREECLDQTQAVRLIIDNLKESSHTDALLEVQESVGVDQSLVASTSHSSGTQELMSTKQYLTGLLSQLSQSHSDSQLQQRTLFIGGEISLIGSLLLGVKKLADTLKNISADNSYGQATLKELFTRISRITNVVVRPWTAAEQSKSTSTDTDTGTGTGTSGGDHNGAHMHVTEDMGDSITDYSAVSAAVFQELSRSKGWFERKFSVALGERMDKLIILLEDFAPRVAFWTSYHGMYAEVKALRGVIDSIQRPRKDCSFVNSNVLQEFTEIVIGTSLTSKLRTATSQSTDFDEVVLSLRNDKRALFAQLREMRNEKQQLTDQLRAAQEHASTAVTKLDKQKEEVQRLRLSSGDLALKLIDLDSKLEVSDTFQEQEKQFRKQIAELKEIKHQLEEQLDEQADQWEQERQKYLRQIFNLKKGLGEGATVDDSVEGLPEYLPGDEQDDSGLPSHVRGTINKIDHNLHSLRKAQSKLRLIELDGTNEIAPVMIGGVEFTSDDNKIGKRKRLSLIGQVIMQVVNKKISQQRSNWHHPSIQNCVQRWYPRGITHSKHMHELVYELGSLCYPDCSSHKEPSMSETKSTKAWLKEWRDADHNDILTHMDLFQRLLKQGLNGHLLTPKMESVLALAADRS